ncbi:histone deacetylase family protein [Salinarimonas soli]|uniref:Histone deacetylase family protein n=1 Tax=Salinarimonas soli TaxID=1638099 RepID=A0A5B2VHL9_9HYPH|nr:histone deacetylase family protein [Salinarimonas soli]KAA2237980.1 histone deacetylase family protein [Salinarimonas soli]
MNLYFDERQLLHRPTQFMVHGRLVTPVENPDRAQALLRGLEALGFSRAPVPDAGLDPIHAVHADHYVAFLREAYEAFQLLPNAGPEVMPNIHPHVSAAPDFAPRGRPRPTGIVGRAGWYMGDLSSGMTADTFTAAYASAQSAIAAAGAVRDGMGAAFAACRPPGHHAYADRASGFCFLNNSAIAAGVLRARFARVAILDIDTHHGDGTQAIFYRRADVLTASVHTDPSAYYPHFVGYADERGAGEGEGFNLNVPLPEGSGDEAYVAGVERIAEAARAFGAEAIVVAAGWDAHRADPLSRLAVTSGSYARLGRIIGGLGLPTLVVQEGGYSLAAVEEAAPLFVGALRDALG